MFRIVNIVYRHSIRKFTHSSTTKTPLLDAINNASQKELLQWGLSADIAENIQKEKDLIGQFEDESDIFKSGISKRQKPILLNRIYGNKMALPLMDYLESKMTNAMGDFNQAQEDFVKKKLENPKYLSKYLKIYPRIGLDFNNENQTFITIQVTPEAFSWIKSSANGVIQDCNTMTKKPFTKKVPIYTLFKEISSFLDSVPSADFYVIESPKNIYKDSLATRLSHYETGVLMGKLENHNGDKSSVHTINGEYVNNLFRTKLDHGYSTVVTFVERIMTGRSSIKLFNQLTYDNLFLEKYLLGSKFENELVVNCLLLSFSFFFSTTIDRSK